MAPGQRSKNGCWTCRLRRKKCYEGGPPCANCADRDIPCHGYGPRPDWKDKGEKEREEAKRMQLHSSRAPRPRPRSGIAAASPSRVAHVDVDDCGVGVPGEVSIESGGTGAVVELTSPFISPSGFPLSPGLDYGDLEGQFDLDLDIFSVSTDVASHMALGGNGGWWDSQQSTSSVPNLDEPPLLELPPELPLPYPRSEGHIHQASEREIELMLQCMDMACGMRQSHPPSSLTVSRPWLFMLLIRSPTIYYASLGITAWLGYSAAAEDQQARTAATQEQEAYRSRASTEFSSRVAHGTLQAGGPLGEPFICHFQLARLEAIRGSVSECQAHLDAAAELFPQHAACPYATPEARGDQALELMLDLPPTNSPSSTERKALAVFHSAFAWNDVLSSSVQRRRPAAQDKYSLLFSNPTFIAAFQETTDCAVWILSAIVNTIALDQWRTQEETQGTLSVRSLVNRADKISTSIEDNLRLHADESGVPTRMFADAVLIELHCIVSGPRVGVTEISDSIDRAVATWKARPPRLKLQPLLWPLCVSANLATGLQREVFREALRQATLDEQVDPQGLHDLSMLLERSWSESDEQRCTRGHDWRAIVQKSKLGFLFV